MKKALYLLGSFLLLAGLAGGILFAYAASEEVEVANVPASSTLTATSPPSPSTTRPLTTTPRASASPTAPPATVTPLPPASATASTTPGPNFMRFHTLTREVPTFHGPGSYYARQGSAPPESSLLVAGRTADGVWWLVCCVEGQSGWLRYDPELLRAEGDITLVAIMSVPPTPTLPPVVVAATAPPATVPSARARPAATATLPGNPACKIAGASYASLPVVGQPNARPASQDPEFNLLLRGYEPTHSYLELMGYLGDTDPDAPQLFMLFDDQRTPVFRALYRVRSWNWGCNCPGGPISDPEVTLVSMETRPGEVLRVPDRSNGDIGHGYKVLVLRASEASVTLKYTREDNVLSGYTIHIENVCVDPHLLALYQRLDREGRGSLPALYGSQAIGVALTDNIKVAIRDTGAFMDPRSRKDWWMGR